MPPQRQSWEWEAAVGTLGFFIILGFELQAKLGAPAIHPPWNVVLAVGGLVLAVVLGLALRRAPLMRFLSGVPFAVCATVAVTVLAIFGTIIVQNPEAKGRLAALGVHALFTSWAFFLTVLLLLLNLATVLGRRLVTRRPGNVGFILNHLGVLVVFLASMTGSPFVINGLMKLAPGAASSTVRDDVGQVPRDIGATLTLKHFQLEYFYPPHLLLIQGMGGIPDADFAYAGHTWTVPTSPTAVYTIHVLDYLPTAVQRPDGTWQADATGEGVAHVQVTPPNGKPVAAWVSESQPLRPANTDWAVAADFEDSSQKAFRSYLTVNEPDKAPYDFTLEVNKPLQIHGWTLYQASYGPDTSTMPPQFYSLLHGVRDPALPLVYLGFLLMVLGAFTALWSKRALTPEATA